MNTRILNIGLGSDHAGFGIKGAVFEFLKKAGYQVADCGTDSDLRTDYPKYAHGVSKEVSLGAFDFGILLCGTGQGMAMTANKYPKVRAAVCWSTEIARLAREHNDANVLCLPGKFLDAQAAVQIINAFLNSPFAGGRHLKRIRNINSLSE